MDIQSKNSVGVNNQNNQEVKIIHTFLNKRYILLS